MKRNAFPIENPLQSQILALVDPRMGLVSEESGSDGVKELLECAVITHHRNRKQAHACWMVRRESNVSKSSWTYDTI